jgi:hypothetical protein
MLRHAKVLVADDRDGDIGAVGDAVDLILYRASVGVDQDARSGDGGAPCGGWSEPLLPEELG